MIGRYVNVDKRKGQRGTSYNVRWFDPRTGKRRSKSCGTGVAGKRNAERFRAKIIDDLSKGRVGDPIDCSWQEFVERFLETKAKNRPKTIECYRRVLKTFKELCDPATVMSVTHSNPGPAD